MAAQPKNRYILGEYSIYPDRHRMDRNGNPVHLQSRPFQVLLYLIENRDRVISRAELLDLFWGSSDVYDLALTKCLAAIRKALDDSKDNLRFIETHYKEGYRYIGPFEERVAQIEPSVIGGEKAQGLRVVTENEKPAPVSRRPVISVRAGAMALIVLVVALAAATYFYVLRPSTVEVDSGPIDSIAVLPLRNLTGDPAQQFFSDGLTESLITELSKIDWLKVISRGSAFAFKDEKFDPQEAGRRLGVEAVMEGSVQRSGDRIRINIRLVSARDGRVLWADDTYDRSLDDIFDIQDEIRLKVASSLSLALRGDQITTARNRNTDSVEAYQAYLKGRYHWYIRSIEDLQKAAEYFEEAIRIDPQFALAHAALAETFGVMESNSIVPPGTAAPKARAHALKALELDNTLAVAYAALGLIETCEWKWHEGEKMFERARALNPNHATALHWRATTLMAMGRFLEAEAELKRAQELDPLSLPIAISLWETYFYSRQTDRALDQAQFMIALFPDTRSHHWRLGLSYMQKGMYEQALDAVSKSNDEGGMRALVLARAGRRDEAQELIKEIVESYKVNDPYFVAVLYSALGEKEVAFSWLERSLAARQANLSTLGIEPFFDPLRLDLRFEHLVRQVGLAN